MSKNNHRYKEDYTNVDLEELEERPVEKFERFRPKKNKPVNKGKKKPDPEDQE
jgi:hypothetical protein